MVVNTGNYGTNLAMYYFIGENDCCSCGCGCCFENQTNKNQSIRDNDEYAAVLGI